MNSGFVGTQLIASSTELKDLLEKHAGNQGWYFVRWAHTVSGFKQTLPTEFEQAEGQMFTSDRELRWKAQSNGFDVLILSTTGVEGFDPMGRNWVIQDWDAHVYPLTETRLPKGIAHNKVNLGQRYFIDQATWTVHFVALVAKETK
ncbi:MAG: hypothetical protein HC881_17115 [Leptolyngbyaceae cyanobacterium SL_7_1]|nr:hypothetical protein [Leptolyngbyaceae cyanobacterium SL_7_1]